MTLYIDKDKAYKHVTILDEDEIDVDALEVMLRDVAGELLRNHNKYDSALRKGIKILDYLKYGRSTKWE